MGRRKMFVGRHSASKLVFLSLIIVFAIRVGYVLMIPDTIAYWRDGMAYDSIAKNVLAGFGYRDTTGDWPGEPPFADPNSPTARWLPGYPVFITGVYLVAGQRYRAVYLAQALLAAAIAGLMTAYATRTFGRRVAALALFIYAL